MRAGAGPRGADSHARRGGGAVGRRMRWCAREGGGIRCCRVRWWWRGWREAAGAGGGGPLRPAHAGPSEAARPPNPAPTYTHTRRPRPHIHTHTRRPRPQVHWVEEYHVDGFRFDLASCLCRGAHRHKCNRRRAATQRPLRVASPSALSGAPRTLDAWRCAALSALPPPWGHPALPAAAPARRRQGRAAVGAAADP